MPSAARIIGPAAKAKLLQAVARGHGCRDVLTIDQHMSRLHSHDTPGSVQVHRRRPNGSEIRSMERARGSSFSKQSVRGSRCG